MNDAPSSGPAAGEISAGDYLSHVRSDTDAIADVLTTNGFAVAVPACPGWTLGDLAWHVGSVHRFWTWIVRERVSDPSGREDPAEPGDDKLAGWLRDGVDELVSVLDTAVPTTPIWTWTAAKQVSFVPRRMAQETAMHRFDAQAAVGVAQPIDSRLAADGVDELLRLLMPATESLGDGGETVQLVAVDTADSWTASVHDNVLTVTRGSAASRPSSPPQASDASVHGPASDLLLMLWRRLPPEHPTLKTSGDAEALTRFLARADLD